MGEADGRVATSLLEEEMEMDKAGLGRLFQAARLLTRARN